ncbi:MAG: hypothetical protein RMI92_00105 [Geminocystis sp.]|nr:hypothetical protein [Geminocystis sp.]
MRFSLGGIETLNPHPVRHQLVKGRAVCFIPAGGAPMGYDSGCRQ